MKAANFVLDSYFARIGFTGAAKADFTTLKTMMQAQLFSVPFENLDVQARRVVSLVPEDIVEKIVRRNRGGYCYELNGLFAMALETLGIEYRFVAARPMFYPVKRPRTHMALIVSVEGEEWLCDLGFGSYGIRAPMPLREVGHSIQQDSDTFMLSRTGEREYLLQARVDDEWTNQYSFDLCSQEWIDFVPANYLNSTHPEAVFVQKLLVVLLNQQGRKILFGSSLKIVTGTKTEKFHIAPDDCASVLEEHFGLPPVEQLRMAYAQTEP